MHPLRVIIRRFDRWLSRQYRVQEFTADPTVIMRIQVGKAPHDLALPEGTVPAGAKVLFLHMWNDRAPLIPEQGPDLAWALHSRRLMHHSLSAVAEHIKKEPSLKDIQAVGGITAHITLAAADGGRAMLNHLGFAVFPYYRPAGAFGEFWENFYTWWLMWTYNPASTKGRSLWGLQRTEFWMTAKTFLEKYG